MVFRIIVVMPNRKIRIVRMEDARVYITTGTPTYGDDLIMLDDVHRLELGADALHLSFMFFCFCQEGEARFKINGRPREMHKHDLLFGFGEQVFEDCLVSDDFKGKMLLVSRKFSQESIVGLYHLWPYLMDVYHSPVIHLEEKELRNLHALTSEGLRRLEEKDNPFLSETIISIMRIFYFDICQILSQRKAGKMEVEKNSRLYAIFDEFMQLLSQNFKKERNVVWYGDEMFAWYLRNVRLREDFFMAEKENWYPVKRAGAHKNANRKIDGFMAMMNANILRLDERVVAGDGWRDSRPLAFGL